MSITFDDLELKRQEAYEELRRLTFERSEATLMWAKDGIATPREKRAQLNYEIDCVKQELTEYESELFKQKRAGRMRFSEALASICIENGMESWVEEAKRMTQCEP